MKIRWKFRGITATFMLIVSCFLAAGWLGIRTYTVLSGSMEPAIPTGALLLVRPVQPEELESGDVITFHVGEGMTATHRVVSRYESPDGILFQTKGDANSTADGKLIQENQIIGSPFVIIPGGGYLIWFLQRNLVPVLLSVSGIAALFLFAMPCIASEKKKNMRKEKYLSR